jgi:hypothetical protein
VHSTVVTPISAKTALAKRRFMMLQGTFMALVSRTLGTSFAATHLLAKFRGPGIVGGLVDDPSSQGVLDLFAD